MRSLNIGPTDRPSAQVGPVIDGVARDRIREYINKGGQEAKFALEMEVHENGYLVGPTIFTEVSPAATIAPCILRSIPLICAALVLDAYIQILQYVKPSELNI